MMVETTYIFDYNGQYSRVMPQGSTLYFRKGWLNGQNIAVTERETAHAIMR